MKTALIILALTLAGCASAPSGTVAQKILNAALPDGFTGEAKIEHKNPYFDFALDVQGLQKVNGVWTWTSLAYSRNDRFSYGRITLNPGGK